MRFSRFIHSSAKGEEGDNSIRLAVASGLNRQRSGPHSKGHEGFQGAGKEGRKEGEAALKDPKHEPHAASMLYQRPKRSDQNPVSGEGQFGDHLSKTGLLLCLSSVIFFIRKQNTCRCT